MALEDAAQCFRTDGLGSEDALHGGARLVRIDALKRGVCRKYSLLHAVYRAESCEKEGAFSRRNEIAGVTRRAYASCHPQQRAKAHSVESVPGDQRRSIHAIACDTEGRWIDIRNAVSRVNQPAGAALLASTPAPVRAARLHLCGDHPGVEISEVTATKVV